MMQIVLELADEVLLETLSKKHKISEPKISLTYEVMDKFFPNLVKKAQNHGPKNLSLTFKNVSCISGFLWDFFVKWLVILEPWYP